MTTPKPEPKLSVAEQLAERKRIARALYVHGARPGPEKEEKP